MFKFLLTFFVDIITPVISSTQVACSLIFSYLHKTIFFSTRSFFCRPCFLLEKIKEVFHIQIKLKYKNALTCILIKNWFHTV